VNDFRRDGHALVDLLADHLDAMSRREGPVLPSARPDELVQRYSDALSSPTDLMSLARAVLADSNHLHHPRYVGHQVTAPLPATALLAMMGHLLNNSMAVYEMGPASTAMERVSLRWMADKLGFPAGSDGVLTSGGSLGNLTALLVARAAARAQHGERPLAIVTSKQTHYCVARAAAIMGLGEEGFVPVAVDERFRLDPADLSRALDEVERRGRAPLAIVASACSTATGAFDPIGPIADIAAARGVWLHVDGAHGASAAIAKRYKHLVAGIERADSVVWDAHKMLLVPALVTGVLFRDGRRSYTAFSQAAAYLFDGDDAGRRWFDVGMRTVECTKRMASLELYGALALEGEAALGAYVERMFDLAKAFADEIAAAPDFELATPPDCNIVCFRHVPPGVADLDALQTRIREAIVTSGEYYLVMTTLPTGVYLRVTVISPGTTRDDLTGLLETVRSALTPGPSPPGGEGRNLVRRDASE
jgi:L-2,4-diaminobutyrate decarboxylase